MSNELKISEYNLEYMGVKCTGVIWSEYIFFFEKDGEKYRFKQKGKVYCSADTDHIRCVIREEFLQWIEKEKNKKLKHMIKVHDRALEMVCEVLKTETIDGEYYMEVIERWKNEKGKDCQSFDYFIERAEKEEEKQEGAKK